MQIKDLGDFEDEIIVFGGPYSNLHATQALLTWAEQQQISDDNMICTGDVVAYCADPVATTKLIRECEIPVVAGNCEKQLAEGALDCGCGFEEGTTCDLLSAGWFAHADRHVGQGDRVWMGECPDVVTFTQSGRRFAVIHGGVSDIARFIWSTSNEEVFQEEIDLVQQHCGSVEGVISGHSGIAFSRLIGGVEWINAGVIGMPPNDGSPKTQFISMKNGKPAFRELDYNAEAARKAMQDVGLTQGYHESLTTGLWPSEDVLPLELRREARA